MKRMRKGKFIERTARILGNNEGASLVLVSVLAIIVLTAVIILRVTTSTFMASANRQLNQDQAYELAASRGASIDVLINNGNLDPADLVGGGEDGFYSENNFGNMPKASVKAVMEDGTVVRTLKVTAVVGKAQYTYTKEYLK